MFCPTHIVGVSLPWGVSPGEGGIAQLAERVLSMHKVLGSYSQIPQRKEEKYNTYDPEEGGVTVESDVNMLNSLT